MLFYHKILALLAVFFYNFPSEEMIVIGVTGTTGKTSTCNMIAKILEEAGFKVGLTTTANFKIGTKEWTNLTKQTMQGRFTLQKLLRQMADAGCSHAIVETSSEGILQSRHFGVDYDVAVFTNLSPEHIESHGSFEKYRQAKEKLFASLLKNNQRVKKGKRIKKVSVFNLDDPNVKHFLKYGADEKYGYKIKVKNQEQKINTIQNLKLVEAKEVEINRNGLKFEIQNSKFVIPLLGEFNVYNALAAICVGLSQGIDLKVAAHALAKIKIIPGRMELINEGQPFKVIVDYAHEPKSLEAVYKTISSKFQTQNSKLISVLGACGGGRDRSKRPILGKLAAQYADYVIITNEDPYDEDPKKIINEVFAGVMALSQETCLYQAYLKRTGLSNLKMPNKSQNTKIEGLNAWRILDRRQAIKKALDLAGPNDIVVITGKGSEQCIVGKNNQKIPWDERGEVHALLQERIKKQSKSNSN